MSYVDGRQADLAHVHRRGGRGGECRQLPAHAMLPSQGAWVAPAEPPASGEAQCAYGEERQKRGSASMLCTVAGWVCGEPDCMRVPSQGPHGGGAERCYTGNEPHETCLLHTRPMRSPGVAWGVDPVTILTITNDV